MPNDDPPIRFCVLTISDRCAAGTAQDTSGPAVRRIMEERLHATCVETTIVPDDEDFISTRLCVWIDDTPSTQPAPDLILTTGGTGLGPRDVTPEATRRILEREHAGLAELMRARGATKTPKAYLSRAIAGTRAQTLIINLPGSPRGAIESLEAILDLLPHAIAMLRGADH